LKDYVQTRLSLCRESGFLSIFFHYIIENADVQSDVQSIYSRFTILNGATMPAGMFAKNACKSVCKKSPKPQGSGLFNIKKAYPKNDCFQICRL